MTVPTWLAATPGATPLASQVNQFLVSHAATYVYSGALKADEGTVGSGFTGSAGQWVAQSFTTAPGQAGTGYVIITASVTGTPVPWTFSVQASVSGAPSGTALASTPVPHEFVSATAEGVGIVLPVSGLTASATYWLVAAPAGDVSDYFDWAKSNQSSGASISTDGSTWTSQSYGLTYSWYDNSPVPPLAGIWEDAGARWTAYVNAGGLLTQVQEFTAGQTPAGYVASTRDLTYSGSLLTGMA